MTWDNNAYSTNLCTIIHRKRKGQDYTYRIYWEETKKTETIKTHIVSGLNGYERITYPIRLKNTYIHRYLMKDHLERWARIFGCNPDDLIVHHIDEDRSNNIPQNMMVMTDEAHKNHHNAGIDDSERRRKISEARIGMQFTEEHKANISKGLTGRKFSEEHRRNLSLAHMKNTDDVEEVRSSPLDNIQSVACGKVFNTPLFLIIDLSKAHIIPRNKFGGLNYSKKKRLKKRDICNYLNVTQGELNKFLNGLKID